MTVVPLPDRNETKKRALAAERQRRYRERRRRGVCVIPVEIDCQLLDALVALGSRDEEPHWDPNELGRALAQIAREALGCRDSQDR